MSPEVINKLTLKRASNKTESSVTKIALSRGDSNCFCLQNAISFLQKVEQASNRAAEVALGSEYVANRADSRNNAKAKVDYVLTEDSAHSEGKWICFALKCSFITHRDSLNRMIDNLFLVIFFFFFFFFFWKTSVLFVDHWYSSGNFCPRFQIQDGSSHLYVFCHLHVMISKDSVLVQPVSSQHWSRAPLPTYFFSSCWSRTHTTVNSFKFSFWYQL